MSVRRFLGLLGCALALGVLTAIGLRLHRARDLDLFVAAALAQGAVYLVAVRLVWHARASRRAVALVLAAAAAMRVAVLVAPPFLSTDIYRYVWDGRVMAAGINPYRYIPADPHLAALRDDAIFPHINRADYAPTIYPPAAEAVFFAVARLGGGVTAMKAAMLAAEAIGIVLLLRLLRARGLPATRIAVYAWHPLPLWEFAGSGHVDALIVAFVALALWSARRRAGNRGGAATGLALALGTLVKLYPAVLFPARWRPRRRRRIWLMPIAFAAALGLGYLPFLGVGWRVLGFLPGYMTEEGFAGGGAGFYWWSAAKALLPLGGVPETAYLAAAAAAMAGLALAVTRRPSGDDVAAAALLGTAFVALLSPHYPWYFAWLIVFACLVPGGALLWLTLASFLLYLVPVGSRLVWDGRRFAVESILYLPFLVLAAIDLGRRRDAPASPGAAEERQGHGDTRG